jgi:hypothetical protein
MAFFYFESVTLVEDTTLFDRAPYGDAWKFNKTSKCLAKGSEAWLIQKVKRNGSEQTAPLQPGAPLILDTMFRAMDDKGQDLGWISAPRSNMYSAGLPVYNDNHIHNVRSSKFEDMPSEVRSAVIQLYLDQDGQSNWEALLASKSLPEIRDMSFSEIHKLFTEHAMQRRPYQDRDSYLKEVERMAAGGIGKVIQLQCARSEEGVSVTLMALSGEELAMLTLSTNEETVGALREAVRAALAGVVTLPRIVLHDGRMLADFGNAETIQTVFDF